MFSSTYFTEEYFASNYFSEGSSEEDSEVGVPTKRVIVPAPDYRTIEVPSRKKPLLVFHRSIRLLQAP
jgi:hypothetical protein